MRSRARLFGHPIHQMLIVFPLGLLGMSVIFDLIGIVSEKPIWSQISFWMIGAGVLSGGFAAIFGWIDWSAIPSQSKARSVGLIHAVGNIIVLSFFLISWFARRDVPEAPGFTGYFFSFSGALLSFFTAWLGGELVNRFGIGVYPHPHVNAPSPLTGEVTPSGEPRAVPSSGQHPSDRVA